MPAPATASSTILIAAAAVGGLGAFLGAGLGQAVQWRRDMWQARLDEKRDRRTARRDAYLTIAHDLVRLQDALSGLEGWVRASLELRDVEDDYRTAVRYAERAQAAGKDADALLTDVRVRVAVFGSDRLSELLDRTARQVMSAALFEPEDVPVPGRHERARDAALEARVLVAGMLRVVREETNLQGD